MSAVEDATLDMRGRAEPAPTRRTAWDFCELTIGYALILAVIWTPRPLQRWLYWAAHRLVRIFDRFVVPRLEGDGLQRCWLLAYRRGSLAWRLLLRRLQ